MTPAQYQLLLAIRGHDDPRGPTIGDVAGYLLLRHHSAVGLIKRAEAAGLVHRTIDSDDLRVVRLDLTEAGAQALERLAAQGVEELSRLARALQPMLKGIDDESGEPDEPDEPVSPPAPARGRARSTQSDASPSGRAASRSGREHSSPDRGRR